MPQSNEELAKRIRAKKTEMFATRDSLDEIVVEMQSSGNSAAAMYVIIAANTVLEHVAKMVEEKG